MSKNWTYDVVETAPLGKPFVPIKVLRDTDTLCNEQGQSSSKTRIRLYMDPRGDVEFAIGIHKWMADLLGSASRKWDKTDFGIKQDSQGHYYILGPTAKNVLVTLRTLQSRYIERLEAIAGKAYIAIYYRCVAPAFDASGAELPPDESINVGAKKRYRADKIDIDLDYKRGVLAENEKFYVLEDDGRLAPHWVSNDTQVMYLPDTEENMAKLQLIRRTLSRAADMLYELFKLTPEEFLRQIGAAPLVPSLPAPPTPPVEAPASRKIVRRSKT